MEITSVQICEELLELLGQFKAQLGRLSEANGLTRIQLFALYTIDQQGAEGLPMGHVATAMHCDASNVTGIVDRLVSQDLAVRQESAHDRRTKILKLTPKGKRIIDGIVSALPIQLGCAKLNATERGTLYDLLHKVAITA